MPPESLNVLYNIWVRIYLVCITYIGAKWNWKYIYTKKNSGVIYHGLKGNIYVRVKSTLIILLDFIIINLGILNILQLLFNPK